MRNHYEGSKGQKEDIVRQKAFIDYLKARADDVQSGWDLVDHELKHLSSRIHSSNKVPV